MPGKARFPSQFSVPDGLIVIDKPRGPSSHQITAWVGEILGARVGHAGTLDPGVSGVLTVMIGKAVRLAPLLLSEEKEYVCLLRIHKEQGPGRVEDVLAEFTGRIYQRPPRKSAVARNLRIRMIHEIELIDSDKHLLLIRVRCDAGTYIRSLCHHIGFALGTGAHMVELRRTRSGQFHESQSCTLQDLADASAAARLGNPGILQSLILLPDKALSSLPKVTIRDTAVDAVCHGAVLARPGLTRYDEFGKGATVVLTTSRGELIALGRALVSSKETDALKNGLIISPSTVFMEPGTYARGWRKSSRSGSP
ncbi:MAG: RNA-guided pseudouridylation complex pseudouridine synthase subunit Cbf5 [Methanoregulaceae archaeon]|jgi:predicted rRNA pseudouridine synthase|nr:RNA-guided pseudouridylation complex pseudouridine synthase subunit Cbf5 [Methanoregulaceae archaeon]